MGKQEKSFNIGDLVFAKLKGHPTWPAKIIKQKNKKYTVYFYGSDQTADIIKKNLYSYVESREKFLEKYKNIRQKSFHKAIAEIEAALNGNDVAPNFNDSVNLPEDLGHNDWDIKLYPEETVGDDTFDPAAIRIKEELEEPTDDTAQAVEEENLIEPPTYHLEALEYFQPLSIKLEDPDIEVEEPKLTVVSIPCVTMPAFEEILLENVLNEFLLSRDGITLENEPSQSDNNTTTEVKIEPQEEASTSHLDYPPETISTVAVQSDTEDSNLEQNKYRFVQQSVIKTNATNLTPQLLESLLNNSAESSSSTVGMLKRKIPTATSSAECAPPSESLQPTAEMLSTKRKKVLKSSQSNRLPLALELLDLPPSISLTRIMPKSGQSNPRAEAKLLSPETTLTRVMPRSGQSNPRTVVPTPEYNTTLTPSLTITKIAPNATHTTTSATEHLLPESTKITKIIPQSAPTLSATPRVAAPSKMTPKLSPWIVALSLPSTTTITKIMPKSGPSKPRTVAQSLPAPPIIAAPSTITPESYPWFLAQSLPPTTTITKINPKSGPSNPRKIVGQQSHSPEVATITTTTPSQRPKKTTNLPVTPPGHQNVTFTSLAHLKQQQRPRTTISAPAAEASVIQNQLIPTISNRPAPIQADPLPTRSTLPEPKITVIKNNNDIKITWFIDQTSRDICFYEIFYHAFHNHLATISTWNLFKLVADEEAKILLMTNVPEGLRFHFIMRVVDANGRKGPFSTLETWH